ncbi:MAG: hypothetical protein ABH811_00305 [archaeon]
MNWNLKNLIAKAEGINPEDVTVTYIHEQREKNIYPNVRYDCPEELILMTRNEFDELEKAVWEWGI